MWHDPCVLEAEVTMNRSAAPPPLDALQVFTVLQRRFKHEPLHGYVTGKARMSDELIAQTGCTDLQSRHWVDSLEARSYIRFDGPPEAVASHRVGQWIFCAPVSPVREERAGFKPRSWLPCPG
jgi:hypothetical protein